VTENPETIKKIITEILESDHPIFTTVLQEKTERELQQL
jgi:hypothetical protein